MSSIAVQPPSLPNRHAFPLSDTQVALALPQQWRAPAHLARSQPSVTILTAATPVYVHGREALEALREAIDAALVPEES